MRNKIVPYSPKKVYKSPPIHKEARKRLKKLGILSEELFKRDDWPEILRYIYTNPVIGWLKPLSMLQQRSGEQFKRKGHKYSIVFQQLVQSGSGELRLIVLKLSGLTLDSPELDGIADSILSHSIFTGLAAIFNIQRGQAAGSLHIHLLLFVPFERKFGTDFKIEIFGRDLTVQNDVEFGQGKYRDQDTAVGTRRTVRYLNNPHDQHYRIPDCSDAKMEVYKEALLDDLEHLKTKKYKPTPALKGVSREMERLVKALDSQDTAKELLAFFDFQKEKKLRGEMKIKQESVPEEQPNPTSLLNLPIVHNPT